jgi:hypothetical protein
MYGNGFDDEADELLKNLKETCFLTFYVELHLPLPFLRFFSEIIIDLFFTTRIQIEATTQGGGGKSLNNPCKLSQTTRAYVLFSEKRKNRKKKLGCCPDPHLCRGKCVCVCLSIHITKYPSSQPFVCVCMLLRVSMDQVQKVCVVVDILVDRAILLDKSEIK